MPIVDGKYYGVPLCWSIHTVEDNSGLFLSNFPRFCLFSVGVM